MFFMSNNTKKKKVQGNEKLGNNTDERTSCYALCMSRLQNVLPQKAIEAKNLKTDSKGYLKYAALLYLIRRNIQEKILNLMFQDSNQTLTPKNRDEP